MVIIVLALTSIAPAETGGLCLHGCRTPAASASMVAGLTARCADTCCFSRCSESQVSRHLLFQQVFCKHGWTSAAAYHTPMLGLGEGRATLLLLRLGGACLLSYAGVAGWEGASCKNQKWR
jgi:hypothetical protein